MPQEHRVKNIGYQPEFHLDVMKSPSPKKIDTLSDRDGLFNGCGGASATGRGHEDINEIHPNKMIRNRNIDFGSQIENLPNLDSKQLSEGEENVMATLR